MKNIQSKYFEFENKLIENKFFLSEFKGWNGLIVIRLVSIRKFYPINCRSNIPLSIRHCFYDRL